MKSVLLAVVIGVILTEFSGCRGDEASDLLTSPVEIDFGNDTNATTTAPTTKTTTQLPVTTTAAPVGGHWRANYSNGHFCIMMDVSSLEVDITYQKTDHNRSTIKFVAPAATMTTPFFVSCGFNLTDDEVNETLSLDIPIGNTTIRPASILLKFFFTRYPNITGDKTLDKSQVYKILASYKLDNNIFVDTADQGQTVTVTSNGTLKEFAVLKDRSYQCNSASSIKLDDRVTLKFTGLRTQAFLANDHFDTPEPCPADTQSSDLVPIIIGAVLAAIVLIVLVAYLIGRARMRRTTYESI